MLYFYLKINFFFILRLNPLVCLVQERGYSHVPSKQMSSSEILVPLEAVFEVAQYAHRSRKISCKEFFLLGDVLRWEMGKD